MGLGYRFCQMPACRTAVQLLSYANSSALYVGLVWPSDSDLPCQTDWWFHVIESWKGRNLDSSSCSKRGFKVPLPRAHQFKLRPFCPQSPTVLRESLHSEFFPTLCEDIIFSLLCIKSLHFRTLLLVHPTTHADNSQPGKCAVTPRREYMHR
jgi:hypothetical protein